MSVSSQSLRGALRTFNLFAVAVSIVAGWYFGADISADNHKDIVTFLLTVAAIIFGVMGAWLSIMKVELQAGVSGASTNEAADEYMSRARGLIEPISLSSFVLIGAIVFILLYHILSTLTFSNDTVCILKSTSFSIICLGAYALIYSIGVVIAQGAGFLIDLSEDNQTKRAERQRKQHHNS